MKVTLIVVAAVTAGIIVTEGANGASGFAGVSADAGGNVGAEGSASGSVDGGGSASPAGDVGALGSMSAGGDIGAGGDFSAGGDIGAGGDFSAGGDITAGGSIDAGGSASGSIDVGGCASVQGGISGDASANGQLTGGDASGGAQGNLQGDASLNGCGCAAQGGIGVSGSANVGAGGQGISASGDASVNWPDNGCGGEATTPQAGHTYKIRMEKTLSQSFTNEVANIRHFASATIDDDQPIVYKEAVNADLPYYIDGSVTKDKKEIYLIGRWTPISTCAPQQDGTWDYVMAKTCNTAFMPEHECSIEPGTYTLTKYFDVQTTFEDPVDCGDYIIDLWVNNSHNTTSFKLDVIFTITDDCNS